jgi:hypothetical protein
MKYYEGTFLFSLITHNEICKKKLIIARERDVTTRIYVWFQSPVGGAILVRNYN